MSNDAPPYRYLSGSQGPDPTRPGQGRRAAEPEPEDEGEDTYAAERHADLQRAREDARRTFDDLRRGREDPRRAHDDPRVGRDDPRGGYDDPQRSYEQARDRYEEPRDRYDEPRELHQDRREAAADRRYGDRRQGYGDRRQADDDEGLGRHDQRQGYAAAPQRAVDTRQLFAEAQRAHAERHPLAHRAPAANQTRYQETGYRGAPAPAADPRGAAAQREQPDDDPERLYESFSDLYEDFEEGRSKTPFVIIGALLAVAIVGGGLAFAYKSSGGSDDIDGPPVVRADDTAARVAPDNPGGVQIPHQDRQVFDQVAGQSGGGSDPVLRSGDGTDGQTFGAAEDEEEGELTIGALARRVTDPGLPAGGQGALAPSGQVALAPSGQGQSLLPSPGPGAAQPRENSGVFEPRRVRTVSIGPDGSIVSQSQPEAPPAPGPAVGLAPAPGQQPGVMLPSRDGSQIPVLTRPAPAPSLATGIGTDEDIGEDAGEVETSLLAPSPRPKPRPGTRVSTGQSTLQPSATPGSRPISSTPAVSAPILEGFAVQVASHRSQAEAVAKFADLQSRYPNLISGYQPLIQRADLGDRGIYYRLRIGPIASQAEAGRLCSSLQSAGLSGCFVRGL